jgi:squalene-associated FAD-dependent desaturase
MSPPRQVVVIGGGFAGLACAVALAGRGVRVTVLEARRSTGGRAGSFADESTGDVIDNGQHLFMACYRDTLRFLTTLGTAHHVRFQKDLTIDYLEPGRRTRLRCPGLPAPWHLVAGTLGMKGLTLADRMALLRAGKELRRLRAPRDAAGLSGMTVTAWLDDLDQTERLRERLWHPLAIATLNESPDAAPASLLARVLLEGFLQDRKASALGYATVGLSEVYTEAARRYLERHEGSVRTGIMATAFDGDSDRIHSVRTREGETIASDAFVCAVPPRDLARMGVPVAGLDRFVSSPILSVNLWFDHPISRIADFDFAGLIGKRVQWVFNKERIFAGRARHLAAVISAARDLIDLSNEDLAKIALEDLASCLPAIREARLTRSMVVRERTATFSATLETEPLRPGPRTPFRNLLLAGDWTVKGMPATIETAVRSGHHCADLLRPPENAPPDHSGVTRDMRMGRSIHHVY